jgi:acyl-CoA thioesterase FadM
MHSRRASCCAAPCWIALRFDERVAIVTGRADGNPRRDRPARRTSGVEAALDGGHLTREQSALRADGPGRLMAVPPALAACVICGPEHPDGLRVRFRWHGDHVQASFTPRRAHQGFHGLMSGGLLAAIFDCMHYRLSLAAGAPSAVTARIEVQYRAPIRLGQRLRLAARLVERRGRVFETQAQAIRPDGVVAAESTAVYVEVPPDRLPPLRLRAAARDGVRARARR